MYNKRFDLNSNHHQCKVNNNTFKPKLQQLNLGTDHLIFGGGAGIFLKKIVCFRTGANKIKCLQRS